ncbi:hypothetical protein [Spirosoma flavum]|uniref:Uncharacterized protein n=1 Tax=Spirosoma flavum TaxID=2048557 RepID=A0ABW6AJL7_9BACT
MSTAKQELTDKISKLNDIITAYTQLMERHVELGEPEEASAWTGSIAEAVEQITTKRDALVAESSAVAE